jgi:hypothetical protein
MDELFWYMFLTCFNNHKKNLKEIIIPVKKLTFTKINKKYVNWKIDFRLQKYMFCASLKWITFFFLILLYN